MNVIGIDFGSLGTKMATIGNKGLETIVNELSSRSNPTIVTYTNREKLVADAAFNISRFDSKTTIKTFTHLFGITGTGFEESVIKIESLYSTPSIVKNSETGIYGYEIGRNYPVDAIELAVSFIARMKETAEKFVNSQVLDCVISCPIWFSEVHKIALAQACAAAGFNCLKLMPHSHSTALDYGLFRRLSFSEDKPVITAFIDIGYSHATVTIAEYTSKGLKIYTSMEDIALGARAMNSILSKAALKNFMTKTKIDPTSSTKSLNKLSEATEKAKKILSANNEATISVECFYEDYDLNFNVNRDEFQAMLQEYIESFKSLCVNAIKASGITIDKINFVEVVGGGTRVPIIHQIVEEIFKKKPQRTLSGDECVARGCAIQAAALCPRFKVAEYNFRYLTNEELRLVFDPEFSHTLYDEKGQKLLSVKSEYILLPVTTCIQSNFCKTVYMPLPVGINEFSFDLYGRLHLGEFKITVPTSVQSAACEFPDSCQFKVKFIIDHNFMVDIQPIFVQKIVTEETYTEKVPKVDEEGKPVEDQFEEVEKKRSNVKYRTTNLEFKVKRPVGWLTDAQINDIIFRVNDDNNKNQAIFASRKLRNDILERCFALREVLEHKNKYTPFITPEDQQAIHDQIIVSEEFADYNHDLDYADYEVYWKNLLAVWQIVEKRYDQYCEEQIKKQAKENEKAKSEDIEAKNKKPEDKNAKKTNESNTKDCVSESERATDTSSSVNITVEPDQSC